MPRARARLILIALSVGLAIKKLSIEIDEPAAGPFPQVIPEEFFCNAGTKTLKLPSQVPKTKSQRGLLFDRAHAEVRNHVVLELDGESPHSVGQTKIKLDLQITRVIDRL